MEQTDAVRLLASADRQLVLHELVDRDGTASIGTLSRRVAMRRHQVSHGRLSERQIHRAEIRLLHIHVPFLNERDVVAVDWDREDVSLGDRGAVETVLEAPAELDQWPPDDLQSTVPY